MKRLFIAVVLCALGGCASYNGRGLTPGQSRAGDVEALMGAPAEKMSAPGGDTLWFYPRQPFGRQTYAVRLGADGVMREIDQRLTFENIQKLMIGTTTAKEARELLGPPWRTMHLPRQQRDVWEYTTYSLDQQEFLLYVQFSGDGIVREVIHLRDTYFDPGGAKD